MNIFNLLPQKFQQRLIFKYLKNNTGKDLVFTFSLDYPRQEWKVPAFGIEMLPEAVVTHALSRVNYDLSEATEEEYGRKRFGVSGGKVKVTEPTEEPKEDVAEAEKVEEVRADEIGIIVPVDADIATMKFGELQQVAKKLGVYPKKRGATREDLERAVREAK